jgi:hypothetical protein
MPTRVAFDDSIKGTTITLLNRGNKPIRYRLVVVDMKMNDSGGLENVPTSENSAKSFLRFAPREVYIQPGEFQKVKIVSTVGADQALGEYRSHLLFEPLDVADPIVPETATSVKTLRVQLKMQTAITVPIFIRHGLLTAGASVSDVALSPEKGRTELGFLLHRTGNRTVRGDCTVYFTAKGTSRPVEVGKVVELPVYYPNLVRSVKVPIDPQATEGRAGEFTVKFAENGSAPVEAHFAVSGG